MKPNRPHGNIVLTAVLLVVLIWLAGCTNPPTPSPTALDPTDAELPSVLLSLERQIAQSQSTPLGTKYYVDKNDPAASDANPGTQALPWKTIQHAADTLAAGETVIIRGGALPYTDDVTITRSGTSKTQMLNFIGDPQGPLPVVDDANFRLTGASYITVAGIRFQNTGLSDPQRAEAPILVEGARSGGQIRESHGVVIRDNQFYNLIAGAILVQATPWGQNPWHPDPANPSQMKFEMVEDITIHRNHIEKANTSGWNEQITLTNGVKGINVGYNFITDGGNDNGGEGIDLKEGCSDALVHHNTCYRNKRTCFYIDGGRGGVPGTPGYPGSVAYQLKPTTNIHIFNNYVDETMVNQHGNGANGITIATEGVGSVDRIFVYNNVIDRARGLSLSLYLHPLAVAAQTPTTAQASNVWFINNTVVNGGSGGNFPFNGIQLNWPNTTNVLVKNNIVYNNGNYPTTPQIESFYPGPIVSHNVTTDPQLVGVANKQYGLTANSLLAIDRADPSFAPAFDFLGHLRGEKPDIGALEFQ